MIQKQKRKYPAGKLLLSGFFLFFSLFLGSCDHADQNPLLDIQRAYKDAPSYQVVLDDMKEEGNFFHSYYHKYKVLSGEEVRNLDWKEVSEKFYKQNENFLGMTIWGKDKNGQPIPPSPAVYQYVGDPKYGRWRDDGMGNSFWEFYGKYMLLTQAMNFAGNLIYRRDIPYYQESLRTGRPYMGRHRQYGTNGSYTKRSRPDFYKRKMARSSRGGLFSSRFGSVRSGRSMASSTRSRSSFGFGK